MMNIEAKFCINRGAFTLNVEINLPSNGIIALFGPSGSGKTTLLRAMAGLDRAEGGYLKIGNTVWQEGSDFLQTHERALGFVFQDAGLFSHLSVLKNLEYGFKRVPVQARKITMEQMITLFALEPLLERRPEKLSGGERQRVAIARAFLSSPRLMLMDEPLAALDLSKKKELLPFFEKMREKLKIPIIYVSHDVNEVSRLADYMILLEKGRVRAQGPIQEMLARLDLPLAHDQDAGTMIEATVSGYDSTYHLMMLEFSGGVFTVSRKEWPRGKKVRIRILARDVSLTLKRQSGTSILNIFKATVNALSDEEQGQSLVRLSVGNAPLLARVTQKSVETLALVSGKAVYAQIKSVALLE